MFTVGSNCYRCSKDIAAQLAALANLPMCLAPWHSEEYKASRLGYGEVHQADYYAWEDAQLGGGACRITWYRDVMWISSHSGYPRDDMTQEVAFYAQEEFGLVPIDDNEGDNYRLTDGNPRIYGTERADMFYAHEGD